jgi:3-hydroxyacyl-[acyl-carrier-protein] dehydratase
MAPPLLFDIFQFDLTKDQFGVDEIERVNPHRGAMRMLDGIIYASDDFTRVLAYKDVRDDEFWVEGHIPGRPLFPGVLMIEAAAQTASYMAIRRGCCGSFLGFIGAEAIKFRGQVVPGDRLYVVGLEVKFKPKRAVCRAQGLVDGKLVFEAKITGMSM